MSAQRFSDCPPCSHTSRQPDDQDAGLTSTCGVDQEISVHYNYSTKWPRLADFFLRNFFLTIDVFENFWYLYFKFFCKIVISLISAGNSHNGAGPIIV